MAFFHIHMHKILDFGGTSVCTGPLHRKLNEAHEDSSLSTTKSDSIETEEIKPTSGHVIRYTFSLCLAGQMMETGMVVVMKKTDVEFDGV